MDSQKVKSKGVRIHHSSPPEIKVLPQTTKLPQNPKSFKIVCLARMCRNPSFEAAPGFPQQDFQLEHSGNISNFFLQKNPLTGFYEAPQNQFFTTRSNSNVTRSYIGPSSIMEPKTQTVLDIKPTRFRKTSQDLKQGFFESGISLMSRLQQIQIGHNKEKKLEKERFRNMSIGERIIHKRQGKILEKFKNAQRDWKSIQIQLAKKLKKQPQDLAVNRAYQYREKIQQWDLIDRQMDNKEKAAENVWYMSLRESPSRGALETHLPVGYEFNRIYARIPERTRSVLPIIRKPGGTKTNARTFKQSSYFIERTTAKTFDNSILPDLDSDVDELQVIGMNKFQLELECAKTLNISLQAPREQVYEEEIIEENYDPLLKY